MMDTAAGEFRPHPLLAHAHLMTIFPRLRPRTGLLRGIPTERRTFVVAPGSRIIGSCHWQPSPQRHGTVVLVHGLEGCSESHYMRGLADKSWRVGLNVIRLNQRNCGGTEHLTPTLYHSGMSHDLRAVIDALWTDVGLPAIWVIGYSMGGNLVLKMTGEAGSGLPALRGALAVCPNIDPAACVTELERPANWVYQRHFLKRLKARIRRKAACFPGTYDVSCLKEIRTLRQFDDRFTAPDGGFASANDYYDRAGARHVLGAIRVPTLILAAQDDPFIPYRMFDHGAIKANPCIRLWATAQGGHCGFVQRPRPNEDCYWAENRLVDWVAKAWTA